MQHTVFLVFNLCIAGTIVFISSRYLRVEAGKCFLFFSSAILFFYISRLLFVLFPSGAMVIIAPAVLSFGSTLAVTALFLFSLEYASGARWLVRYIFSLFVSIATITQILYWVPESNQLFQNLIHSLDLSSPFTLSEKISFLYNYSLLTASAGLLASFLSRGKNQTLRSNDLNVRFWTVLTGPLVALIAQGLLLLGVNRQWPEPVFFFSLNLSALGFAFNIFQNNRTPRSIFNRDQIIENMEDGWIVTDAQNHIVDYNEATAKFLGKAEESLYGKPLQSIFTDFPKLAGILRKNLEVEIDRTLSVNHEYRFLNIKSTNLYDPPGHLILWRDITNRKRAEEARHQARDEMFVLLNAITNSASQTSNLSEFLSEAIYQIVYPFRSQMVLIYLIDDRLSREGKEEHYLAASSGISADQQKALGKFDSSIPLFKWIEENRQPLLFESQQDHRIPKAWMTLGMKYLLVVPLLVQTADGQKLIGAMCLGRKSDLPYQPDDSLRLTILSDQIANLIDSDRRRKLAIALSERQRLMRDIHDSVSQKLYGLVTLTEAAQAAIEAGSQPDYDKILSRISENARQAVKELRLFLFQLQPIDLEKEGLISVLHHRLAAVEGRADIKARFLADETISISKRKEIALYYIAQEALNNVLRHAKAKSVTITLKQGYKYVTLDITDDGSGFDKTNMNRGGLGLKNITERVKQEKGKLKISSHPDKGTIITVSFEIDDDSKSKNN